MHGVLSFGGSAVCGIYKGVRSLVHGDRLRQLGDQVFGLFSVLRFVHSQRTRRVEGNGGGDRRMPYHYAVVRGDRRRYSFDRAVSFGTRRLRGYGGRGRYFGRESSERIKK